MTIREAQQIMRSFYQIGSPSEQDIFLFTEALAFLIRETKEPQYMMELGGYYYEQRQFDLALKYYELAAEYNDPEADVCLGYIWYYGRTGQCDYEKAFHCFSRAGDAGNLRAAIKLADMHQNGYFVRQDGEKYRQIIEELYPRVKDAVFLHEPLPEVFTRLARIRAEAGRTAEAAGLYLQAKEFLAQRISKTDFFGDINIMMGLVDALYALIPFNPNAFDLHDLCFLLTGSCRVRFRRAGRTFEIEASSDGGEPDIRFGERHFRSRADFFRKARIGNERLTAIYDSLYGFEVEAWRS